MIKTRYDFNSEVIPDKYNMLEILYKDLTSIPGYNKNNTNEFRMSTSGNHFMNIIYREIWSF